VLGLELALRPFNKSDLKVAHRVAPGTSYDAQDGIERKASAGPPAARLGAN
jgi:hypothetical protein